MVNSRWSIVKNKKQFSHRLWIIDYRRRAMKKTMALGSRIFILSFLLFFAGYSLACADKIYLKDGKVYEGKLLGKSPVRYLFSVNFEGESAEMSFFLEDVNKLELGKDTVEEQIPYLKEVESLQVEVKEQQPKTYEFSLYGKNQGPVGQPVLPESELKKKLTKNEYEYYQRFNDILKRYADKYAAIQHIYLNLTTANRDDYISAKQYMDELYFELNKLFVPEIFKKAHITYLESVRATFLGFDALEHGKLDEAAKQIKQSEDSKQNAISEFREVIVTKTPAPPESAAASSELPLPPYEPSAYPYEGADASNIEGAQEAYPPNDQYGQEETYPVEPVQGDEAGPPSAENPDANNPTQQ